jgi:hypothetical protein
MGETERRVNGSEAKSPGRGSFGQLYGGCDILFGGGLAAAACHCERPRSARHQMLIYARGGKYLFGI